MGHGIYVVFIHCTFHKIYIMTNVQERSYLKSSSVVKYFALQPGLPELTRTCAMARLHTAVPSSSVHSRFPRETGFYSISLLNEKIEFHMLNTISILSTKLDIVIVYMRIYHDRLCKIINQMLCSLRRVKRHKRFLLKYSDNLHIFLHTHIKSPLH